MSDSLKSKLKATRKRLGITQKQLAARLEIPLPTIVSWENDQRTPYPFTARQIVKALDAMTKDS